MRIWVVDTLAGAADPTTVRVLVGRPVFRGLAALVEVGRNEAVFGFVGHVAARIRAVFAGVARLGAKRQQGIWIHNAHFGGRALLATAALLDGRVHTAFGG